MTNAGASLMHFFLVLKVALKIMFLLRSYTKYHTVVIVHNI